MTDVDSLVKGAIDMHIHNSPVDMPCLDGLEIAQQARQAGMRAIVLKHHSYPTAPVAELVDKLIPEVSVFGSICLEYEIGGLNHHAVKTAGKLGRTKVVWMPTISATNSRTKVKTMPDGPGPGLEGDGFSILDESGALAPELDKILPLIKQFDMVLANGHLSPEETFPLFKAAKKVGIDKLVVTHPGNREVVDHLFSLEELGQLADMGAFIENTALITMPGAYGHDPAESAEMIKAVGAKHCIISTDLGPKVTFAPVEGLKKFISSLMENDISPDEIELMIKTNPARLLGLD